MTSYGPPLQVNLVMSTSDDLCRSFMDDDGHVDVGKHVLIAVAGGALALFTLCDPTVDLATETMTITLDRPPSARLPLPVEAPEETAGWADLCVNCGRQRIEHGRHDLLHDDACSSFALHLEEPPAEPRGMRMVADVKEPWLRYLLADDGRPNLGSKVRLATEGGWAWFVLTSAEVDLQAEEVTLWLRPDGARSCPGIPVEPAPPAPDDTEPPFGSDPFQAATVLVSRSFVEAVAYLGSFDCDSIDALTAEAERILEAPTPKPHLILEPGFSGGRPTTKNRVEASAVVSRLRAGESVESLIEDFGITREEVELCRWWGERKERARDPKCVCGHRESEHGRMGRGYGCFGCTSDEGPAGFDCDAFTPKQRTRKARKLKVGDVLANGSVVTRSQASMYPEHGGWFYAVDHRPGSWCDPDERVPLATPKDGKG